MSPLRASKSGGEEAFGDILMPLMWEVGIGVCPPLVCYKNYAGCPRFLSVSSSSSAGEGARALMVSRKREGARRILLLHVGGRWGRWASGRGEGAKDDTTINHQRGRGSMVHLFVYLLLYQMYVRSINPTNQPPNILPSPIPPIYAILSLCLLPPLASSPKYQPLCQIFMVRCEKGRCMRSLPFPP